MANTCCGSAQVLIYYTYLYLLTHLIYLPTFACWMVPLHRRFIFTGYAPTGQGLQQLHRLRSFRSRIASSLHAPKCHDSGAHWTASYSQDKRLGSYIHPSSACKHQRLITMACALPERAIRTLGYPMQWNKLAHCYYILVETHMIPCSQNVSSRHIGTTAECSLYIKLEQPRHLKRLRKQMKQRVAQPINAPVASVRSTSADSSKAAAGGP